MPSFLKTVHCNGRLVELLQIERVGAEDTHGPVRKADNFRNLTVIIVIACPATS